MAPTRITQNIPNNSIIIKETVKKRYLNSRVTNGTDNTLKKKNHVMPKDRKLDAIRKGKNSRL